MAARHFPGQGLHQTKCTCATAIATFRDSCTSNNHQSIETTMQAWAASIVLMSKYLFGINHLALCLSMYRPYVPPRAAWQGGAAARGINPQANSTAVKPQYIDPIELPEQNNMQNPRPTPQTQGPSHTRKASDNYYEDVAPHFVSPVDDSHHLAQGTQQTQPSLTMPQSLVPGLSSQVPNHPIVEHHGEIIDAGESYDNLPDGQRSPASDNSEMTSISQRGINPNWRPGSTDALGRLEVPQRHAQQQKRDMLLHTNPDFDLNSRGGAGSRMPPVGMGQAF